MPVCFSFVYFTNFTTYALMFVGAIVDGQGQIVVLVYLVKDAVSSKRLGIRLVQ